jgi:hypothetical protein
MRAGESIPLPSTPAAAEAPATPSVAVSPPPPASPRFVRRLRGLDVVLAVLMLLFAAQVACFRASNSDLFLHLAAGRAVTEGKLLAPDPFSFTSQDVWVNHSWLTDLVAYQLFRLDGERGVVLVVLKALCVAVLAWVMLRTATQKGRLMLIPALCVLLAVLTLSPRLLLQSTVLSFLLLGVTLWLLERARAGDNRSLWMLPAVCLLWVNLDSWFLLGPLTVGLYLAGELLQKVAGAHGESGNEPDKKEPTALPPARLGVVLVVCLAACLVNPFHFRAFTLPAPLQFGDTVNALAEDAYFRSLSLAPWQDLYFDTRLGLSAAGLAYFALLLAGLASFAMTAPRWRWWRVLVWLAFAALSVLNVRAIPFFAVVAGPITALNFLDGAARYFGAEVKGDLNSRQLAVVLRILCAVAAVALLVLGVSGKLQATPHFLREFGVGVRADEGLRETAQQVARWRQDGKIADDAHFFNTTPDAGDYLAYYSPGAKTFLDHRITPFRADVAKDYRSAREALHGNLLPEDDKKQDDKKPRRDPTGWRAVFANQERKVDYVVFHSSDVSTATVQPTLRRLYGHPREFTAAHVSGATAVFSWRNPDDPTAALGAADAPRGIDFAALAFDSGDRAPLEPPSPASRSWYDELLPQGPPHVRERNLAWHHRERFDGLQATYDLQRALDLQGVLMAYQIGTTATGWGRIGAVGCTPIFGRFVERHPLVALRDSGPVESLYLAVRAARRSLRDAPEDAVAYRLLADAYTALHSKTRERLLGGPWFGEFRRNQATAALVAALSSDPSPDLARDLHRLLSDAYAAWGFIDLEVEHLGKFVERLRDVQPSKAVPAKKLKEFVEAAEKQLDKRKTDLKTNQHVYTVNSSSTPVVGAAGRKGKIDFALENGLAETALELFEKNAKDFDSVPPALGSQRALQLVLRMGRLDKAREVLGGDDEDTRKKKRRNLGLLVAGGMIWYGLPAYEWYSFQVAAAAGDYKLALASLDEALEIANARPSDAKRWWAWESAPANLRAELRNRHVADLHAMRAWLKLEVGDTKGAGEDAKKSVTYALGLDVPTRGIAELVAELSDPVRRQKPLR